MKVFLAFVFFFVSSSAWCLRFEALPDIVQQPAVNGPLSLEDLTHLALVVSGTQADKLAAEKGKLEGWKAELAKLVDPESSEVKKGELVLSFLHDHMKSYSVYQTKVDTLLDTGFFNCVSSAVVYMILGRSVGLDVQAVATSDHAFCLVNTADKSVDVETTTRYGFDPGTKTEFKNSFGNTGFIYTPPGNYRDRKTIGDRQLLGLLIQNRMADYQRSGRPDEDVGLGIDRWTLEKTPEAFKTLIDGFINYGAWLNGRKEYLKGLDLVDKMVEWTNKVPESQQLLSAFLNNQINVLLEKEDFAGALALENQWKNRGFLTPAQAEEITSVILGSELSWDVKNLPAAQAMKKVEDAFDQHAISTARRLELLTYLYGLEIQKVAADKGSKAAWTLIDTLPEEIKRQSTIRQARGVYTYNWAVEVHNQFAKLYNAGNHAQAKALLQDALSQLPESDMLKKDWEAVKSRD